MVLVTGGSAVPVYAEAGAHELVRLAAADLVEDIERVTGCKSALSDARIDSAARRRPLPRAIVISSLDRWEVIRGMELGGRPSIILVVAETR